MKKKYYFNSFLFIFLCDYMESNEFSNDINPKNSEKRFSILKEQQKKRIIFLDIS